jgi:hypothetical protein
MACGTASKMQAGKAMNVDDDHQRAISNKIERLRRRAKRLAQDDLHAIVVVGILLGILDLLGDEL